jgi:hypothetical protein
MAAEMETEEARIGWRQQGKTGERKRESKCAKNAYILLNGVMRESGEK